MAAPQGKRVEADDPPSIAQVQEEPQGPAIGAPIAGPVVQRRRDKDENRGGYECEFVHPPPTYLQTECPICLLVLRSPHLASCCSHHFCKECIERVQKAGKCCPLCNKENFILTYNRDKDVSLQQTEVYCPHHKIRCEWRGKLEMLNTHLNANPKPIDKQLEGCAFVEVQCYNDGCGLYYQRQCIIEHQCRECPLRVFSCEHCHEYESTYHDLTTNHWPVCKCYPLPCPHECRQETIERQNLEQHLNEECPLQEVECEFKYAGCESKLPRKDMPDHLRDNVGHMTLLARQNQMLAQQNQELMAKLLEKEEQFRVTMEDSIARLTEHQQQNTETLARQNEDLKARLLEKDEQLRRTMEENRREMEDSITRLTERQQQDTEMLAHQNEELKARLVEKDEQLRMTIKDNRREMEDTITELTKHQRNTETLARQNEEVTAKLRDLEEQVETQAKELRKEMNRIEQERSEQTKRSSADVQEMRQTVAEIKEATNAVDMIALGGRITELQSKTTPVQIVMTNFERHKRDSDHWFSDGFYTHPQGYKLCLRVNANGRGSGTGTHVSCYICLMRGDFDNHLKWPFRGSVTFMLLNQQEDKNHHTVTVLFNDHTPDKLAARVTSGERAAGSRGKSLVIPHSELGYKPATNCQYLVNDCLYFQVKAELH